MNSINIQMIDTILIPNSLHYISVTTNEDIQIINSEKYDHWRCIYFNCEILTIYDNLFCNIHTYQDLDDKEKMFLSIRYPSLKKENISFDKVQQQPDGCSCGIFAAAYVVTKLMNKNPSTTNYSNNMRLMRSHFIKLLIEKQLIEFPTN